MTDDHRDRFDRVESLLFEFDTRMDEGEPGDQAVLDEVRYHLDWIQAVAGEPSFDWLWAHYLSAEWHRCRARMRQDVREIDAAVAELRLVVGYSDTFYFRLDLVELIQIRYNATDADDRPYLAEVVAELRALASRDPDDEEDRAKVLSLLGQTLREQFRRELNADENPAPELLDEAEHCLYGSLDLFDADAESLRAEAVVDLAKLLTFRFGTTVDAYARDRKADREEAIALYEMVALDDPAAAFELSDLLMDGSDEMIARTEALRVLDTVKHSPRWEDHKGQYAARRSDLLISRARGNRAELPGLIDHLVDAFAAQPEQGPVGLALTEAYWLAGDAEGVVRTIGRLAAITDGEDVPPPEVLLPYLAIATASLALRGRADRAEAEHLLRMCVREPSELGWTKQLPHALLAMVVDDQAAVPESLATSVIGDGNEKQSACDLLDWLRQHERPGPDWLCAVAAMTVKLVEDPDTRLTALHAVAAARAAVSGQEPFALELLVRHAMLLAGHGEDTNDRDAEIEAAVLLDEYFGVAGVDDPLRTVALGLHGAVVADVHARGGVAGVPLDNAKAALEKACADPDVDADLRSVFLVQLARLELLLTVQDRADHYGTAISHCREAMSLATPGTEDHDRAWFMLGSVLLSRFHDHGDHQDHDAGFRHLRDLRESKLARGLDVADVDEVLRLLEPFLTSGTLFDLGLAPAEIRARLKALDDSDLDPMSLVTERFVLLQALLKRAQEANDLAMTADALDQLGMVSGGVEAGSAMYASTTVASLYGSTAAAAARGDSGQFLDGIAELEAIRDDAGTNRVDHGFAVFGLSMLWHTRHKITRSAADLDQALRHYTALDVGSLSLRDATGLLDGMADSCWSLAALGYGTAAISVGFDTLRIRARHVLLQNTGEHAAQQAADAAARGQRVALRCAASGEFGRAVEAVEWGRGLVLHSATFTSGIAARLKAAGHVDLAAEFESGAGAVAGAGPDFAPSDVRRRALAVLGNVVEALTPPSSEEIASALRSLDAAGLVHLVPGQDGHTGRALVTTADGAVSEVLLPLLLDGPDSQVGRYLAMDDRHRREALPALCAWAWRAAVEPLLHRFSGGLPWLVLVPAGALGVVPWHAAAGEGRTAVREAGFTYAASARQLCELAQRDRQPVGASPVVVSNPAGTLAAAQYEAEFLHGLYPHGHFYGQVGPGVPVRGAGTPDEVLGENGASLQHLGCHASAGATPAQSALELARADLSVERMLRHAAARRNGVPGGLVVLAACESDLTASLHDESLTLASAYVAAGATGVVGTKWKVDDVESALLMCVFYDFLARRDMRPRDALRAVQLWALDHDRVVPAGVARHLSELGRAASLANPVYWAAFAHHGW
ncbi:CHAT domain-containing protein [Lentzea sp. BCCO 10_0798]|uniref:CHAT domain-containing protein n=1 Tax=Lentzea kristufekii TaxID=3095430 RepID=A0ABU4TNA6_9PSEU|nr:CHAT domain-containing protein [Lentzea sp. BCCO 10_0798]MDX8049710.1 CHAT domain-containing protein [Lentzea sp. BCCO 10_0798]